MALFKKIDPGAWVFNARVAFLFATIPARHVLGTPLKKIGKGQSPIESSIDITQNCNLRCKQCYLFNKKYQEEGTSDEDFLNKLKEFRKNYPSIIHNIWVGGEPMLRKSLLIKVVKYFPLNSIITNGTIPIDGRWPPGTNFFISVDGTEKIHNELRPLYKKRENFNFNVYQRAKKTANEATAPVALDSVINRLNMHTIPDLIEEWKRDTKVKGYIFSFYTPMKDPSRPSGMTKESELLYMNDKEGIEMVNTMLKLKRKYPSFILMSEKQIKLFLPENRATVWGKSCPNYLSVSLDSTFKRKFPCVMGSSESVKQYMDCKKCGCINPSAYYAATRGPDKIKSLIGFTSFFK